MGILVSLAAGAATATQFAQALKQVMDTFNESRSVALIVENFTGFQLNRIADDHAHGGFAVTPNAQIPPQTADVFGAQKKGGFLGEALWTGTEGSIMYDCGGRFNMEVYWNNPYSGPNSCSAWLMHPQHGGPVGVDFRVVATCGVGNEKAEMRYELIPHLASVDDHLYTVSVQERDNAVNVHYYRSAAIACYVFDNQQQNTVPLFRLSNSSVPDHFYTPDAQERNSSIADSGYVDEGVACYIHNAQQPGTTPLYRLFNPGRGGHLYTASVEEHDGLVQHWGFRDEGISGYIYATQQAGTVPFYRLARITPHFGHL
jgi:hypothetical protein